MEQMQTTMLNMLQAMAVPQSAKKAEPVKTDEGKDFRSMMEKQSEKPEAKEIVKEHAEVETELPEKEELDETAMQELAAMQMFVADTMQIVTVAPEETAAGAETVLFVAENAELTQQPMAAGAEMQTNMVSSGAEQIAVEQAVTETAEFTVEQPAAEMTEVSAEAVETEPVQQVSEANVTEQKDSEAEADQHESEESFVENAEVSGEQRVFQKVETAPVKVSDTAETQTMETENVSTQISDKLTETLASGETRVELQLTPDHLGKITIELIKSSDGALHVSLFAESSETRHMLERDMGGLQSLLSQNVRQDVQVEVSHGEEAQQHESYDGHQQHSDRGQEQKQDRQQGEDFLDQLRLGLIHPEDAAS